MCYDAGSHKKRPAILSRTSQLMAFVMTALMNKGTKV